MVFVAGTGRSGTTMISNVIGQLPGCLSVGEARYAWGRGMAQDQLCGCGQPFHSCPLWTSVLDAVRQDHPGFDSQLDPARIAERIDARLRVRLVPTMAIRRLTRRPTVTPHPDDELIVALYRALAHRPGVTHVVDSSKLPPYAILLAAQPGIDVQVVHVVRDPRATAFSWKRKKATRDANDRSTMPQLESWRSSAIWLLWNAMVQLWWPRERRVLVRYEDFAADPARELSRVAAQVGLSVPDGLIEGNHVRMGPTHSVAGNPDRLDAGAITLRNDDEWVRAMPRPQRLFVTVLTLPGLRWFGYRFSPSRLG